MTGLGAKNKKPGNSQPCREVGVGLRTDADLDVAPGGSES